MQYSSIRLICYRLITSSFIFFRTDFSMIFDNDFYSYFLYYKTFKWGAECTNLLLKNIFGIIIYNVIQLGIDDGFMIIIISIVEIIDQSISNTLTFSANIFIQKNCNS